MTRLPISGVQARWRVPCGHDDVVLAESGAGLVGALVWVSRCVVDGAGVPVDAGALPVGDVDHLVVTRRAELLGDSLVAEGRCSRCTAAVDVRFSLSAYADHHRVRVPRGVRAVDDGWWQLPRHPVRVRVPSVDDVLAASAAPDPHAELVTRCLTGTLSPAAARAGERAMAALGPTLRADVAGSCPECEAVVDLDVDARELCLSELRLLVSAVYDDVHLVASSYRWSQDAILDLPSARRRRYADLVAGHRTWVDSGWLQAADPEATPLEASVG